MCLKNLQIHNKNIRKPSNKYTVLLKFSNWHGMYIITFIQDMLSYIFTIKDNDLISIIYRKDKDLIF